MKESKAELIWAIWQFAKTISISCISGIIIICLADNAVLPSFVKTLVTIIGIFIIVSGIVLAILKEIRSRLYQCEKCNKIFKPEIKSFFNGNRCPECNSRTHYLKRDIQ